MGGSGSEHGGVFSTGADSEVEHPLFDPLRTPRNRRAPRPSTRPEVSSNPDKISSSSLEDAVELLEGEDEHGKSSECLGTEGDWGGKRRLGGWRLGRGQGREEGRGGGRRRIGEAG
jgi:hypothetical protein